MRPLRRRLLWHVVALGVALLALAALSQLRQGNPRQLAFDTGWLLIGALTLLAAYHLRKRIPVLPLGAAAAWLQLHVAVGLGSGVLFALHAGLDWPTGALERALALLFAAVFGSGVAGLMLSRGLPPRLAARGEELLLPRIPVFRRQLELQAEEQIRALARDVPESSVPDYYLRRLQPFFARGRHYWQHLLGMRLSEDRLLREVDALHASLAASAAGAGERDAVARLRQLVRQKLDLDFHHSLQWTLQAWLVVHLPLTWALLLVGVLHGMLALAFSGDVR